MVSVKAKGGLITGHKISELKDIIPNVDVRVAAINRDENLIIPKGSDTIDKGDEVFFISAKKDIKKVISTIYQYDKGYKNIMIAGGGRIGRRLANSLESKYRIKIIEADKDRCVYLNEKLENSLILHGDSSDSELLEEENIDDESETYELLVSFNLLEQEYGLYIPLDPFFIVGKLVDQGALLIEDDEFDKVQPLIESELEKSSL